MPACCPAVLSPNLSCLHCAESEVRLIKRCRELNAEIVANAAKVQTALKLNEEDQVCMRASLAVSSSLPQISVLQISMLMCVANM